MTLLQTRAKVDVDGNVTVSLGQAFAGEQVEVTIEPVTSPHGLTTTDWLAPAQEEAVAVAAPRAGSPIVMRLDVR